VLITYTPSVTGSTVTGIKHPKFGATEKDMTWQEAIILLHEIKPLIVSSMNQRLDIFNSMMSITENEGKIIS